MKISELLLKLIKSAVSGKPVSESISVSDEDAEKLYLLSKKHDMAHIVSYSLNKNKIQLTHQKAAKAFEDQHMMAVFRYERQNYDLEQLRKLFTGLEIRFIPLKGSVIRTMYPEVWMRTGCDIDVLIHKEDIEKAKNGLENTLKYTPKGVGNHDIGFVSPGGVYLELHYSLLHSENEDKCLKNVWKYANLKSGCTFEYELSYEMFYYYHIYHMAKHFVGGGCGIKPFVDMWVMNTNGISYSAFKNGPVKKSRFNRFAEKAEKLCDVWFGTGSHDGLTLAMQEYIFTGGVYGSVANKQAAKTHSSNNKLKYYVSRIWLPDEIINLHYPELKNNKWKMPFYQIKRWGKVLFAHNKETAVNGNTNTVSQDNKDFIADMVKQLKL